MDRKVIRNQEDNMKVIGYIFVALLLIGFGVLSVKIGWWDMLVNLVKN